jgi:hypothetical protein
VGTGHCGRSKFKEVGEESGQSIEGQEYGVLPVKIAMHFSLSFKEITKC